MPDEQPGDYRLLLRPVSGDRRDPALRLRAALKLLLRSFGLRCVRVEQAPAPQAPEKKESPQ